MLILVVKGNGKAATAHKVAADAEYQRVSRSRRRRHRIARSTGAQVGIGQGRFPFALKIMAILDAYPWYRPAEAGAIEGLGTQSQRALQGRRGLPVIGERIEPGARFGNLVQAVGRVIDTCIR